MKNTTLTVTFNTEKLDALRFHMEKRDADLQAELNDTVQRLYEKYVPQATREYIDDKVSREPKVRDRPAVPPVPQIFPKASPLRRNPKYDVGYGQLSSDQQNQPGTGTYPAHSPRVAPCGPLCGLLQAGVASVYPCRYLKGCRANVSESPKV